MEVARQKHLCIPIRGSVHSSVTFYIICLWLLGISSEGHLERHNNGLLLPRLHHICAAALHVLQPVLESN